MDAAQAADLHDQLLASKPDAARHDSDICPFCVDKASSTASDPSRSGGPDVTSDNDKSTEGGTNPTMSDISQEAHEALLAKAVAEATKVTDAALEKKTEELAQAQARISELETAANTSTAEVERLNKDLDDAQVKLTSATEEVANLKKEATEAAEKAKLTEVAAARSKQVENLKLFPAEYVTENASKWAALSDDDWAARVEEWTKLRPEAEATATETDAASAMTGTSDATKETGTDTAGADDKKPAPRRAVLGLVS